MAELDMEAFFVCKSYAKYEMNRRGVIRERKSKEELKPFLGKYKEVRVKIDYGGKKKSKRLGEMFARTFVKRNEGENDLECLSGDWNDLSEDNFRWCNLREEVIASDNKEWRIIDEKGFSNYEVCEDGRVRNKKNGKIMSQTEKKKGALYVYLLCSNGKVVSRTVSGLVARAFLTRKPGEGHLIGHKDGDFKNNHKDNLVYQNKKMNHIYLERPVDEYDINGTYIRTWSSISAASRNNNISFNILRSCCVGKYTTAGGKIWRFKGEAFNLYPVPEIIEKLPGEVFVDIPGTKSSKISNYGRVMSVINVPKLQKINKDGKVSLTINGKHTIRLVAKLVADAFLPNPNNYKRVDFIDGNPKNIRIDNLMWAKENADKKEE